MMVRSLQKITIRASALVLVTLLASCAGPETTKQVDLSNLKQRAEYVEVDPRVQSDFDSAVTLIRNAQYAQAAAVLKSVIEREQRFPAPYVNLALANRALGDEKAAEENLISALKLELHHPVANNELGLLYRKQGKFQGARTAYENAIKEHPDYLPARRNLGVLCDLYMHDFDCAYEQFSQYLERQPDDKTVKIWLADVKQRLGN